MGGLSRFDPLTETFVHFVDDPTNPHSITDSRVREIVEDRQGRLWIGTEDGGLNLLDPQTPVGQPEEFTHYRHDPQEGTSLAGGSVLAIYEDSQEDLWIGIYGSGMNYYNRHFRIRGAELPGPGKEPLLLQAGRLRPGLDDTEQAAHGHLHQPGSGDLHIPGQGVEQQRSVERARDLDPSRGLAPVVGDVVVPRHGVVGRTRRAAVLCFCGMIQERRQMRLDSRGGRWPQWLVLCAGLVAATSGVADEPGTIACFDGSPAQPIEQFRTVAGQGTFEMWPESFQPAEPIGSALPANRDSTQYNGFQVPPGEANGLEFFYDLDIVATESSAYLFMSYNAGFQIWNIGGAFAASPQLVSQRDGWLGDFQQFDAPFHYYFKIWDIAAIDPPGAPGDTLVALPGDQAVGFSIWDATNKSNPFQLYQDTGRIGFQVTVANIEGRSYAFYASNHGVDVYDMSRSREIGPCFETTSSPGSLCGGTDNPVWRGRLEPWPWGRAAYLDVMAAQIAGETRHFLAVSDEYLFAGLGAEIREITAITQLPPASTSVLEGLSDHNAGLDLFTVPIRASGLERYYLGTIDSGILEIYDLTACLAPASVPGQACAFSADNHRYSQPLGSLPSYAYLQFSESQGRPFLYQGFHSLCSLPPAVGEHDIEHLLDLEGLAGGGPIVEISGESYNDPNHLGPQRRISYWSSYYDQATDGSSAFAPHGGRFHGAYFYRGAQTLFDVHRWTGPPIDPSLIFADGFESGTTSAWSL